MTKSTRHHSISEDVQPFLPEYVTVDDRSIEELLYNFIAYAKQIPFVNEEGNALGTWDTMYSEQVLYLWVDILLLDLALLEREKNKALELWVLEGPSHFANIFNELLEIIRRLFKKAQLVNEVWIMEEIIAVLNDSLLEGLEDLKYTPEQEKTWKDLAQKWRKLFSIEGSSNEEDPSSNTVITNQKQLFNDLVNIGINCLYVIQKKLQSDDYETLMCSGKHPPHISLLYGFFKSFGHIQKEFNTLSKKHLDYYYKTILQQKTTAAQPDSVYLFLELLPEIIETSLKKKSLFLAGQNSNGNDIHFELEKDFILSSAVITNLKTLLINKNKEFSPLNKLQMVTGIYTDSISPKHTNENWEHSKGWPLCGVSGLHQKNKKLPDLGWAFSSAVFYLTGGQRKIQLNFQTSDESTKKCQDLFQKLCDVCTISNEELSSLFFNNAFDIQITTANGWFSVDQYAVSFNEFLSGKSNYFQIQFTLTEGMPAWIHYSKKIHGTAFDSSLPLIQFKLKQETVYYPYSFLKELSIQSIDIDVSVSRFKNLICYNKHGLVDTSAPFPILGMNPLQGNNFYLGSEEWLHKKLISLDCKISWQDLPNPNFKTYYSDYSSCDINDESFKVYLNNDDPALQKHLPLFSLDEDKKLKNTTIWESIELQKIADEKNNIQPEVLNPSELPLAFVCFELCSPIVGFGSDIYIQEMALYGQNILKFKNKDAFPLPPKKPFVPYAKTVEVNYQSTQLIPFDSKSNSSVGNPFEYFHIHPYGIIKTSNEQKIGDAHLLPDLSAKANLYIGLENAVPQTVVSLFFKLIPPSNKSNDVFKLSFHYLAGSSWLPVPKKYIIENSINSGQETGTVKLILPEDLESNHPFYDSKKNWLQFSVDSEFVSALGNCIYINTNVIVAKRSLNSNTPEINGLPPLSISSLITKNTDIQSVTQPFHSFEGKNQEEENDLYARVSSRLGHKNRTIRPRDYKRMILEKFPEVNWMKILTSSKYPNLIAPGNVFLLLMPAIKNPTDQSNYYLPKKTLQAIKKYVLKNCVPRIKISVSIPYYEQVQVHCTLIPKEDGYIISKLEVSEIINQKIAPWLYRKESIYRKVQTQLSIGNLVGALKKHPQVKTVSACEIIHIYRKGEAFKYFDTVTDGEIVSPSNPKAVLIPSQHHEISQSLNENVTLEKLAINTMEIGEDFILKKKPLLQLKEAKISATPEMKKRYIISLKNLNY